jgi:hypothetical protein
MNILQPSVNPSEILHSKVYSTAIITEKTKAMILDMVYRKGKGLRSAGNEILKERGIPPRNAPI